MSSLLGLFARFSHSTLRTFQPRVFSLTSQKRNKKAEPTKELFSIEDLPPSASKFLEEDLEALRVGFKPALNENDVIPNLSGMNYIIQSILLTNNTYNLNIVPVTNLPAKYNVPHISRETLEKAKFDVGGFQCISDPKVRTFFDKLHDAVFNGLQVVGTDETFTDTLVDDLLRIAELNEWPLKIRNHPPCKLYIGDQHHFSAIPEFLVRRHDHTIIGVVDKHLKNVWPISGFGESQIAVEILACSSENMRLRDFKYTEQTIFAVRVISTYVTFYKTVIPVIYWKELEKGLPKKQSIEIQRWPADNSLRSGFDLAEPDGRRTVLNSLFKISRFLAPRV
ncbi:hypothetical protein Glove_132g70 [Diversispora epigaea]|uniref:Uncharacterized protein n=1 Tax=Diversispora epigaea TaxID=1348612 RepID=A0A397J428_9GLOM|nr:hypothetical protein Glove_132g70 [Diversispora epigaea]